MVDDVGDRSDGIAAAASLADPQRRRVYDLVCQAPRPVGRDDVAQALGIGLSLATYHLDLLVKQELVTVTTARRSGRTGPGAGRPAKLYTRSAVEVTLQLPARENGLLAHLLATAIEADETGAAREKLRAATRAAGQDLGSKLDGDSPEDALRALADRGYEPYQAKDGIRLRNCPFHHLVEMHLDLVCALNQDLLGAMVEASGVPMSARLDPQPGHCCVLLTSR
ncbi:MAG: ArsR family transcriptional regulator [Frankiales bacterium]|nr:ArsR family transcriptional regulator [Frankiales bacterium]